MKAGVKTLAWSEGWEAAKRGAAQHVCPYMHASPYYHHWREGWRDYHNQYSHRHA